MLKNTFLGTKNLRRLSDGFKLQDLNLKAVEEGSLLLHLLPNKYITSDKLRRPSTKYAIADVIDTIRNQELDLDGCKVQMIFYEDKHEEDIGTYRQCKAFNRKHFRIMVKVRVQKAATALAEK